MNFLADLDPPSIWNAPNGSSRLWIEIVVAFLAMSALLFAISRGPSQIRRPIIAGVTFLSGLFYVLYWLFPQPIDRSVPSDAPRNLVESVSFWISDAQPVVENISNIIAGFLIGLGVYSLLRIHFTKVAKRQRDWGFSVVLIVCVFAMTLFGYWDWHDRVTSAGAIPPVPGPGWGFQQYTRDLLFDGLLQQMDAGMFSMVAFYIMSAAYRAFRARSVEATILLLTALVVLLSFLSFVQFEWDKQFIEPLTHGNKDSLLLNLRLTDVAGWLRSNVQTPAIRGIDFGVGIGLLAMGLRIWLSLERTGGND